MATIARQAKSAANRQTHRSQSYPPPISDLPECKRNFSFSADWKVHGAVQKSQPIRAENSTVFRPDSHSGADLTRIRDFSLMLSLLSFLTVTTARQIVVSIWFTNDFGNSSDLIWQSIVPSKSLGLRPVSWNLRVFQITENTGSNKKESTVMPVEMSATSE